MTLPRSPDRSIFIKDCVGLDYHNDGHTHVDALCHVGYRGLLYNDRPEDAITERGANVNAIEALEDGLVGRGVLIDCPAPAAGALARAGRAYLR